MLQMKLFTKQKQNTNFWLLGRKWRVGGGKNWETGIDTYTLLYIK